MGRGVDPLAAIVAAGLRVPAERLADGTWVYAPLGQMWVVDGGERVRCHACGEALTHISVAHLRRHDMTQAGYRERFGLNRKTSLLAPALVAERRAEGKRRWTSNAGVREGLSANHDLAASGELNRVGVAAQPAGSRRLEGRRSAVPGTQAARDARAAAAHARWTARAVELGFADLEAYLADRRATRASTLTLRAELGCGGSSAERLLRGESANRSRGSDAER